MKILVTGAAGFIGYHLSKVLSEQNYKIVGLDNLNDYYDIELKLARLRNLGVELNSNRISKTKIQGFNDFYFYKADICDTDFIKTLFSLENFDIVIHLAAQAGVRYSIINPDIYIKSNIDGYFNIIKNCKDNNIDHFIYASSSSVYGNNQTVPFSTEDPVNNPISLYAATKKSNELLAYTYSHLFNLNTTGLRFFTVYGPWGRPDMAYYKFTEAILANETIPVFNSGNLERDFTYIDDIVLGIIRIIDKGFVSTSENSNYAIYNIGKGSPVKLMDFINTLEKHLTAKAKIEMFPMQDGDVLRTWADIKSMERNYNYRPSTNLDEGIKKFVTWYLNKK